MTDNIIIVGAPRSGTNMLRDVLTSLPGMATWPCDEINLYWKHHNRDFASDELTPAHARPEVSSYMHRRFDQIGHRYDADTVVEKTCATSLRVAFTATIFPEAKYLFIRRDGLDSAASAMQRWDAPLELGYVAKKLLWAPPSDLPFYGSQFVSKRIASRRAHRVGDGAVAATHKVDSWWGPKPHDYRQLQERHTLDEVAMIQWQRCVETSLTDLAQLPGEQVMEIVYEDFVVDPAAHLEQILQFLGKPSLMTESAVRAVSSKSIGKGRSVLGEDSTRRLVDLAAPTLSKLGYV